MRTRWSWTFLVLLLTLVTPFAVGCGDDDDGGGGTPANQVPEAVARQQALGSLQLVDSMVLSAEAAAMGDLTSLGGLAKGLAEKTGPDMLLKDVSDPVFTGDSWTITYTFTSADGSVGIDYRVQFLDGAGNPQMEPDEWTESVNYWIDYDYDYAFSDDQSSLAIDFTYGASMAIGGLPDGPFDVDGAGSLTGTVSGSDSQQGTFSYAFDMDWDIAMMLPAGGCPTGTAQLRLGAYRMEATYDGSSTVSWEWFENGTSVANGTTFSSCGAVTK